MIGQIFSHYRILERLGDSAFPGPLYKAEELESHLRVELRVLHSSFGLEERKRLVRIAAVASELEHPNVESFVEFGETEDGELFCCGRFRDGETLDGWIGRAELSAGDALDIVAQIAKGLSRTHRAGIVHGSLKPELVKLLDTHRVEVVGFGFAVLAGEGLSVRSEDPVTALAYRSPEQIRGGRPHPRIDVWALGVMLFEMLAGRRPFEGATAGSLAESILGSEPPPISEVRDAAPAELDRILARALSKEADQRYQGVVQLVRDLAPLAAQVGKPERPRSLAEALKVARVPAAAAAATPPAKRSAAGKKKSRKSGARKEVGKRKDVARSSSPRVSQAEARDSGSSLEAAAVEPDRSPMGKEPAPVEKTEPAEEVRANASVTEHLASPAERAPMQWVLYGGGLLLLLSVLGWLLGGF